MNKKIVSKKVSDKERRIIGGSLIPRQITSGSPDKWARTTLKFGGHIVLLGAVPYDSVNLRNSTYQTISGLASLYAGMSNFQLRYSQCTVLGMKVKAKVFNTTNCPLAVTLYPARVPTADHTTSYYDKRQMPEAKMITLGGYASYFGTCGEISHSVDFSKLWGYDISTTNNGSFIHNLGTSAPGVISSMELMITSLDSTTVASATVQFELQLDVLMQSAIQPLN
jgi:hypothetical protein